MLEQLRLRRSWLGIVGGAALIARLPLLVVTHSVQPGDSTDYVAIARQLGDAHYEGMFRVPGFPAIRVVPASLSSQHCAGPGSISVNGDGAPGICSRAAATKARVAAQGRALEVDVARLALSGERTKTRRGRPRSAPGGDLSGHGRSSAG